MKDWKLSGQKNKVAIKHTSEEKSKDMESILRLTNWKTRSLQKKLHEILSASKHLVKLKRIR